MKVEDITKRAGESKMNCYTHFTIKEQERAGSLLEHGRNIRAIVRILLPIKKPVALFRRKKLA